ncbi:MAG TPA: hypothetical protein VMU99_05805 [Acidimicrobiales bacterium]|nr:hypothetical protein [Acidimicrobiales bacterium]
MPHLDVGRNWRAMALALGPALFTTAVIVWVTGLLVDPKAAWTGKVAVLSYAVFAFSVGVLALVWAGVRADRGLRQHLSVIIEEGSKLLGFLNDASDEGAVSDVGLRITNWHLTTLDWLETDLADEVGLYKVRHNFGGPKENHRDFMRHQTEGRLLSLEQIWNRL